MISRSGSGLRPADARQNRFELVRGEGLEQNLDALRTILDRIRFRVACDDQCRNAGAKLADYFRLPSVRHYLIIRTEDRVVIHHARGDDGAIATHIIRDGALLLEPPGIVLPDCFPPKR